MRRRKVERVEAWRCRACGELRMARRPVWCDCGSPPIRMVTVDALAESDLAIAELLEEARDHA